MQWLFISKWQWQCGPAHKDALRVTLRGGGILVKDDFHTQVYKQVLQLGQSIDVTELVPQQYHQIFPQTTLLMQFSAISLSQFWTTSLISELSDCISSCHNVVEYLQRSSILLHNYNHTRFFQCFTDDQRPLQKNCFHLRLLLA